MSLNDILHPDKEFESNFNLRIVKNSDITSIFNSYCFTLISRLIVLRRPNELLAKIIVHNITQSNEYNYTTLFILTCLEQWYSKYFVVDDSTFYEFILSNICLCVQNIPNFDIANLYHCFANGNPLVTESIIVHGNIDFSLKNLGTLMGYGYPVEGKDRFN